MSQASTQPAPRPAASASPRAVRIVLFGMPDAGKSSLLGALAQAAQIQEHVLNGRLIDTSQGLLELQRRLYEERPRETLEEVAPFPVRFEPFPPRGAGAAPPPVEAILIDCDGRVANELLSQKQALDHRRRNGALAKAVLAADTLILVVDSSADPATLKRDFTQFALFLRLLEAGRGQRTEVSGLPVYLVLTKADLLAQKGDTVAMWMDRIEERKREVDRRFQEFLAQQTNREHLPFGRVELHLWATAVKRPALTDAPARPREPYGVAELFRQALDSAVAFQEQRQHAERWLRTVVGLVAGIIGLITLLTLFLIASQPPEEVNKLALEVQNLHASLGGPSVRRLRDPLQPKIEQLRQISAAKHFTQLPEEDQQFVKDTLAELTAYQQFTAQLHQAAKEFDGNLTTVFDEETLNKAQQKLKEAAPPPRFRAQWAKTDDVQRWQKWTREANKLEAALTEVRDAYQGLIKDALLVQKLADQKNFEALTLARAAQKRAESLLKKKEEAQPIEGEITYAQVFRMDSVVQAQRRWEGLRKAFRARLDI